jgi:hypothetical protein
MASSFRRPRLNCGLSEKGENMEDESTLFERAAGNSVTGYLLLKSTGGNVPPNWIKRYAESRVKKHSEVAAALKGGLEGYAILLDWEEAYRKECFYRGIRALFELERDGKTKL